MKKTLLIIMALITVFTSIPLSFATSGACSYHGGVSCSSGPDFDDSVICNDGWKDSTVSFNSMQACGNDYCSQKVAPQMPAIDSEIISGVNAKFADLLKQYDAKIAQAYYNVLHPPPLVYPDGYGQGTLEGTLKSLQMRDEGLKATLNGLMKLKEQLLIDIEKTKANLHTLYYQELYKKCSENKLQEAQPPYIQLENLPVKQISNSTNFTDVDNTSQYYSSIQYVKASNIAIGYPDGTFKPDNKINRAEFSKILISAAFPIEVSTYVPKSCFSDVSAVDWFSKYVCLAKDKGVVTGYKNNIFGPNRNINVAEALKISLVAFFTSIPQTAGSTEPWYQNYLNYAVNKGIMLKEWGDIKKEISRGEMAQFIFNIKQSDVSS